MTPKWTPSSNWCACERDWRLEPFMEPLREARGRPSSGEALPGCELDHGRALGVGRLSGGRRGVVRRHAGPMARAYRVRVHGGLLGILVAGAGGEAAPGARAVATSSLLVARAGKLAAC